jgi:hypothetical protein
VLFNFGLGGQDISPAVWAMIMLGIIATILGLLMLWRERDIPFVWVLVWAIIGIADSQADTALVAIAAWTVSVILILAMVITLVIQSHLTRRA